MRKRLKAHKLVYYRKSAKTGTRRFVVHKGIFYGRDVAVLKYMIWLAGCPLGDIVDARDIGIEYNVPMMSPQ